MIEHQYFLILNAYIHTWVHNVLTFIFCPKGFPTEIYAYIRMYTLYMGVCMSFVIVESNKFLILLYATTFN